MTNQSSVIDTILVGDALEQLRSLPDNSIDLGITSPPYNKGKRGSYGWLATNPEYSHSDDHMPEDEYQAWQVEVLNELYRVIKPGGSLFYNHKLRWQDGVLFHPMKWITLCRWHLRQEIVWDRYLAANVRGWRFYQVDERIYWLYKPIEQNVTGIEMMSKHAKMSSIWRLKPEKRLEEHPAPFPIELPIRIIYSLYDEEKNRVIIDPFCGTGTALVAAKLLGHSYIGIDISPTYAEYARLRFSNLEPEKNRVDEELKKHVVTDPFVDRKKRGTVNWPYGPKPGVDPLVDETQKDFFDGNGLDVSPAEST